MFAGYNDEFLRERILLILRRRRNTRSSRALYARYEVDIYFTVIHGPLKVHRVSAALLLPVSPRGENIDTAHDRLEMKCI